MKKLFSEIPLIKGTTVTLEKLRSAKDLGAIAKDEPVYRYLPAFLEERQTDDMDKALARIYSPVFENRESLFLGIYQAGRFCGIGELYGYRDPAHKVSLGYRLLSRCWGRGIATEAVGLMVDYLYSETDIEIITASTMIENKASARVLQKNDFIMTVHDVGEDWGYSEPTATDKWFR